MTAEELKERFGLQPHVEHGAYTELNEPYAGAGRAPSGVIYYYVGPGEITEFHRIDCDEYWCWHAGSELEVWQISGDGAISVQKLGTGADCLPMLRLPAGVIFASRNRDKESGCFLSCITAPRFSPEGFTMFSEGEMRAAYPELDAFYTRGG